MPGSAVGSGASPSTLGDWQTGPAWSTIDVPLAIAACRQENPPQITAAMKAAITESDTAAAESIWEGLGDPVTAVHKVEDVLKEAGDSTTVQSAVARRGSQWRPENRLPNCLDSHCNL
jgi:crotonobetainyl-CoA:carnitine CoA-transferase CaiB-like acyl-CoA transferase